MSDYIELKRLAQAATPGRNFDRLPMAGGGLKYECTGDDGSLVLKVDHKNDEWGFVGDNGAADEEFFLACPPAVVLALIAENERVKARLCMCRECAGQGEVYSGHSSYQGHNQPPEPDMDVCGTCGGDGVLGPLEDFEALAAERDKLRAELAGLRTGFDAQNEVIAGLRKDAERWRFVRNAIPNQSPFAVWREGSRPFFGKWADEAIDAAMGKGGEA